MAKTKTPKQIDAKIRALKSQIAKLEQEKKKCMAAKKKKAPKRKAPRRKASKRRKKRR